MPKHMRNTRMETGGQLALGLGQVERPGWFGYAEMKKMMRPGVGQAHSRQHTLGLGRGNGREIEGADLEGHRQHG